MRLQEIGAVRRERVDQPAGLQRLDAVDEVLTAR